VRELKAQAVALGVRMEVIAAALEAEDTKGELIKLISSSNAAAKEAAKSEAKADEVEEMRQQRQPARVLTDRMKLAIDGKLKNGGQCEDICGQFAPPMQPLAREYIQSKLAESLPTLRVQEEEDFEKPLPSTAAAPSTRASPSSRGADTQVSRSTSAQRADTTVASSSPTGSTPPPLQPGQYACAKPGCNWPTYDGKPGGYCSKKCSTETDPSKPEHIDSTASRGRSSRREEPERPGALPPATAPKCKGAKCVVM
jgi:hypothetical protein